MSKRGDRVNHFIMVEMGNSARTFVNQYLSTKEMKLNGVDDFDAAMGAIVTALYAAYAKGVDDALEVSK